jgi:hypothetical protein
MMIKAERSGLALERRTCYSCLKNRLSWIAVESPQERGLETDEPDRSDFSSDREAPMNLLNQAALF